MIGMKGFLISEADYSGIIQTIRDTGIDALARDGAMLHIFQADTNGEGVTVSQLNQLINENTELPQYLEFLHSGNAIAGFMLILQNCFQRPFGGVCSGTYFCSPDRAGTRHRKLH